MIKVKRDIPLAPFTTWNIGGPAEFLIEPCSEDEILESFILAKQLDVPVTVIGRGSNVLIADDGIAGITLLLRDNFSKISLSSDKTHIKATAGISLPRLAGFACRNKLAGFEFLIGIPGTVGGGIAGNAGKGGPAGQSLKDILVEISALNTLTGKISTIPVSQLGMDYRSTSISQKKIVVLSAKFKGSPVNNNNEIILTQKEIISGRRSKFPLQCQTTGSVFKTPKDGKPAGWYIDQAGLKGKKVGGVAVSNKHANWIENTGSGTASDVIKLLELIKDTVFQKYKLILKEEICFLPKH